MRSEDGVGNHEFEGLAVAGFAWSTKTTGLVVAAMSESAEGVLVNATKGMYSVMGLYYSTDAGVTWKMATLTAPWPSTEKYCVRRINIILTSQTRLELSVLSRIIGANLAGGKYF